GHASGHRRPDAFASSDSPGAGPSGSDRFRKGRNRPRPGAGNPRADAESRATAPSGHAAHGRHGAGRGGPSQFWLFGRHAIEAALLNVERRITRLVATKDAAENLSQMRGSSDRSLPDIEIL